MLLNTENLQLFIKIFCVITYAIFTYGQIPPFSLCQNGWSALLVASEQGHLDIVQILLKHNARVDVFDEVLYTIYTLADNLLHVY